MPKITVKKEIVINVPPEKAYESVRDFHQWPTWSPWLILESGCKVTYAEDGKSHIWEGDVVGSGEMAITGEKASRFITLGFKK